MRKSRIFIAVTAIEAAVLAALLISGEVSASRRTARRIPLERELVRRLELTDLAIWTEARYTRHPSQADRFAPFQDVPSSLEHFPSGSVVAPPADHWRAGPPGP